MKKFISFVLICLFAVSFASAHRGRTDAQGGHNNYENESGLGSYHYHHGYEAHLHENGVCPYETSTTPEPTQTESTALAEPEPQQTEPTQQEQQHLLEPVSEEDIDYSQFESIEEAYESGYFYALYQQYSNLYEKSEDRSKLESLLNLGILTNLYFRNSKITFAQPTNEVFTNEDAFEEGKVQGSDDLENTLSEYKNSDFYKDNEIYKAGYNAAIDGENIDTSGAEQAAYQKGYKKGINDTKAEYTSEQETITILKSVSFVMFFVIIILGYKLLKR